MVLKRLGRMMVLPGRMFVPARNGDPMRCMKCVVKAPKKAKVLVVDGNLELLKMLQKLVSRAGHEAYLAGGGDEALQLAEQHEFDLIITDLIMPGKEGVETILTFKKRHPRTKIIAMSGGGRHASGPDYLGIAENLDVAGTLVKPFSTVAFLQTVSRQLECLEGLIP